jgi:AcrR family transcriptional regulator
MGLREKQALARREQTLAAAKELVRTSGSIRQLSMRTLAAKAEVSVQTVYNLFGSKSGVLHALRMAIPDTVRSQAEESRPSDPLDYLFHVAELGAKTFASDPPFLRILMKALMASNLGSNESNLSAGAIRLFQRPIEDAIGAGLLRADADAEFVARHLVIGFLGVLDLWVREIIDDAGLSSHLLSTFTLMVLRLATETSRARLVKHYHQRQRELPRVIRQIETPLPVAAPARVEAKRTGNRKPASGARARDSRLAALAKTRSQETIMKQLRYVLC